MSESGEGEEAAGEGSPPPKLPGEDAAEPLAIVVKENKLIFADASKCLSQLGKDESGMRYAYLKISATDRKLTDVRTILNFRHLLFVDVSGNFLNMPALNALADLPFLIQLNAQRNFIESGMLSEMLYLQDLSLARNQITISIGIKQPLLEYLDINFNQIYELQLDTALLPQLKLLELRGNYLYELGGTIPASVEKLYLAENRITKIIESDVAKFKNLQILHLRNNHIRKLNGFSSQLENLKYINLRQNKINKMRQFKKLSLLPNLETLVISQNPVSGIDEGPDEEQPDEEFGEEQERVDQNRVALLVLLPNLNRINKIRVTYDERQEAKQNYDSKYKEIMDADSSDEELDAPTTTTEYITDTERSEDEEA